jgi:hexosaminidase
VVPGNSVESERVGQHLANAIDVESVLVSGMDSTSITKSIGLTLDGGSDLGDEGYVLEVDADQVVLRAHQPAGLFRGVQTLRQLLGAPGPDDARTVPGVRIVDRPTFGWRGIMLDVARHFFSVDTVKHLIDIAAYYKLNVLHLHLTDDQGWRIAIDGWPKLTEVGGQTQVGGGPGGYYTKADYAEIVAYAADRYISVVPEVDVPGHTHAALVSYPDLNCDDQPGEPFTGVKVGFSSLCVDKPITDAFLTEVFAELAEMTPGRYLHIGGDEAQTLTTETYGPFMERVQKIVQATGKEPVGWQECASGLLVPGALVQYWNTRVGPAQAVRAVAKGARVIMSPANHAYLDMKYDEHTELGLKWAGFVDVEDAYRWDPATLVDEITEADVAGVEAALWTETVASRADIERMVLPRLPAIAEVAWSRRERRHWTEFRERLASHCPRWDALGLTYYRSSQIPWPGK